MTEQHRVQKEKIVIPPSARLSEELCEACVRDVEIKEVGRFPVVDVSKLARFLQARFGSGSGRSEVDTRALLERVVAAFPRDVLTEEQLRDGDIDPKPLFYVPDSADGAARILNIKMARFQTTLPQVLKSFRMRTSHPVSSADGGASSSLEVYTGLYLFHPKYGDGFRDESGVLYVRNPKTREYARFSGSFLEQCGIHKNYFLLKDDLHGGRASDRSLREGLRSELPRIVRGGLLDPERDVRQVTAGSEILSGRGFEHVGVTSSGSRMIRGVLHYIGKDLYRRETPVRITEISPELGCVIDGSKGEPRVMRLFNIVRAEDAAELKNGQGKIKSAGKSLTLPRDFSAELFGLERLPGETKQAFDERCEAVDRGTAYFLLEIVREFPELASMFKTFSPTLLAEVGKTAYWLDRDNKGPMFREFISSFGIDGVRTFLAAAVDPQMREDVLAFANDAENGATQRVFHAFAEFSRKVDSLETYLHETFGAAEREVILEATQQLLNRGRELLRQAHSFRDNPTALEKLLEGVDTEQRILGDLVPLYVRRGYDLKDIIGVKTVSIKGGQLAGTFREAVSEMHRAGYEKNPDYSDIQIAKLQNDLTAKMDEPGTEFKLVVTQGTEKPIAALRFDYEFDRSDPKKISGIFLASVMASDSVSGSRIGLMHTEAQIRAQLEEHSVSIRAICNPTAAIVSRYLEMGFVVTGFTKSSDGKLFFETQMSATPTTNPGLKGVRQVPESSIVESADKLVRVPSGTVLYQKPASIDEIAAKLEELKKSDENWCIARYFKDKKSEGAGREARYYAVFALAN